ncbi:hypothetical protein BC567DRAFT_292308, partial [Phyllosticta citribraziliensis]
DAALRTNKSIHISSVGNASARDFSRPGTPETWIRYRSKNSKWKSSVFNKSQKQRHSNTSGTTSRRSQKLYCDPSGDPAVDDNEYSNDDNDGHCNPESSSTSSSSTHNRSCGCTTTTRSRTRSRTRLTTTTRSTTCQRERRICQRGLYGTTSTTASTTRRWKRGRPNTKSTATSAASSAATTSSTSRLGGLRHSRAGSVASRGTTEPHRLAFCGGCPPARHRSGQSGQCADLWPGQERSSAGADGVGVLVSEGGQDCRSDSDSRLYVL